jgi:acylphosphatase
MERVEGEGEPGGQAGPNPAAFGGAALHITVSGRVQGVGFRYSCYAEARRLGLRGWVRNTPEGDVEVWVESPRDSGEDLEAMLRWLHRGPPRARVDQVRLSRVRPTGAYREFLVEP